MRIHEQMKTKSKTTPRRAPVKGAVNNGNCVRTTITLPKSWREPLNTVKRHRDQNMSQLARSAIERVCIESGVTLPRAG